MVSTYLVHHGYCATAEAFANSTGQGFEEDLNSIKNRQSKKLISLFFFFFFSFSSSSFSFLLLQEEYKQITCIVSEILKLVLAGRMGEAIELTSRLYPGLLERDPNLLFALKCRQFVEMVNGSDSEITQNSNINQTSVIQSTKAYTKPSTNGNVEEMNMNNAMNGSTEQQLVNGQIENDVDMEENVINGMKSNTENGYQNGDLNTNRYKCQNGEDVDMGEMLLCCFLFS